MTYSFVTCFGITHFNCWFFDYAPFLLVRRPTTAGKKRNSALFFHSLPLCGIRSP